MARHLSAWNSALVVTALLGSACGATEPPAPADGGTSTGGTSAAGTSTGGVSTGGVSTGGVSTGGVSTGGTSTGGTSTGDTSTGGTSTGGTATGGTAAGGTSTLESAFDCSGVFNPDQILEYTIVLAPADHAALLADTSFALSFEAELRCGAGPSYRVAVERKRSGGASKVGLKVDLNHFLPEQTFFGLKKLGFDNGVSSGAATDDATPRDVLAEYLGWRLMQRAGVVSSRAVLARVRINDGAPMVYVHVEQLDKRFLAARLGEDEGWLYKKSGGDGDGLKTHETDGLVNPYESRFCFWQRPSCAMPAAETLAAELPERLDIPQMLRLGAVNAIIANTDGLLFKDNNYYHYDSPAGRRTYFPWDLDTTMATELDVLAGSIPGGTAIFRDVLFSHWHSDYVAALSAILNDSVTSAAVSSEIERVVRIAAAAIDEDPALTGTALEAGEQLEAWWSARLQSLAAQLP